MINIPGLDNIKKDPKKLTIIILGVSGMLIAAFAYLLLFPQMTKLGTTMGKYSKAKADLKAAREEITRIDRYKADIGKFKEKIDLYEKKLPLEQEMPSILENLDAMAKKSRLDILAITPVPTPVTRVESGQKAAYQEFLIRISLRCGYHELGRILTAMESADRFMKVVDIDIKASEATPLKHSVELLMATYILLKDKETREVKETKDTKGTKKK